MSGLTFHYTPTKFNFPRSYIKGFVGSAGITNMHITGEVLIWDYLFPLVHAEWVIQHRFFVPSSNVYSLDYVFDEAASFVYLSGSPISGDVFVRFWPMTTEPAWRIWVYSSLTLDEAVKADLTPLPHYWNNPP